MRKQVFSKIYPLMLLITILSSSYATLCDVLSKDGFSCTDDDIELVDDGGTIDSNESNVEQLNDTFHERVSIIAFAYFGLNSNHFSYLQNTYEIYLGHNTPPPK